MITNEVKTQRHALQIARECELPAPVEVAIWPGATHIGLIYMRPDNTRGVLHLAWHHRLTHEDVPDEVVHVHPAPRAEPARLMFVAAMCERIWKRHRRNIPYGFKYDRSKFEQDGTIHLGPDENGLTCATFVLAVFHSVGVRLLDVGTWPERPEDEEHLRGLLNRLEERCEDSAHLDALRKETSCARYRPLEVAGGASFAPASFETARAAADQLGLLLHLPRQT